MSGVSAKHPFQFKVDYAWTLDWRQTHQTSGSWPATPPGSEVVPEVLAGNDQPEDETFAAIMERFKYVEPEKKDISTFLRVCEVFQDSWWAGHWKPSKNKSCDSQEEPDDDEDKPKKRAKPKASLLEEAEDCWQVGSDLSDILFDF